VKISKKISFSYEANPLFCCQNAQKRALFGCQYVFSRTSHAELGVDSAQLTEFSEITHFQAKNREFPARACKIGQKHGFEVFFDYLGIPAKGKSKNGGQKRP
jgi:hypothetical protein